MWTHQFEIWRLKLVPAEAWIITGNHSRFWRTGVLLGIHLSSGNLAATFYIHCIFWQVSRASHTMHCSSQFAGLQRASDPDLKQRVTPLWPAIYICEKGSLMLPQFTKYNYIVFSRFSFNLFFRIQFPTTTKNTETTLPPETTLPVFVKGLKTGVSIMVLKLFFPILAWHYTIILCMCCL